jgi:hypothetical protein
MAVSMKMAAALWNVVPYSLVEVDQHFRGAYSSGQFYFNLYFVAA